MKAYGFTDTGLKRSNNQDSYLVDEAHGIFIVADGMGGHLGGEIASKMAVERIQEYLVGEEYLDSTPVSGPQSAEEICQRALGQAIHAANRAIVDRSLSDKECKNMGTTVVMVYLKDGRCYHAHVGDSRLYRIDGKSITRVTKDHSRVQELIDTGTITEEEAERSPFRNIITRALGGGTDVDVDLGSFELDESACYLMCSDGVHGCIPDKRLRQMVQQLADDPEVLIDAVHAEVNEGGAPDNLTLVLLIGDKFVEAVSATPPPEAPEAKSSGRDTGRFRAMAMETTTINTAKLAQDQSIRDLLGLGPDSIAEEMERREEFQRMIIGLVVVTVVLVFVFLSYFNYSRFYVQFNPVTEVMHLTRGKFFPTGMMPIDKYSFEEPTITLNSYVVAERYRAAVNQPLAFNSKEEAQLYISEFLVEMSKNLASKRVERDLKYAVKFLDKASEFNPEADLKASKAMAYYDLGTLAKDRMRFEEALRAFQQADENGAAEQGLPIEQSIEATRIAFFRQTKDQLVDFISKNEWSKAQELIEAARKRGFHADQVVELQRVFDEKRKGEPKAPVPPPGG